MHAMHRAIFVNFTQVEAPPAFADTVRQQLDELAAHCPGLLGCTIHVDREQMIAAAAFRFRVRVSIGLRLCDSVPCEDRLKEHVDVDLGAALRRALDAAKRAAGCRAEVPVVAMPLHLHGRAAGHRHLPAAEAHLR
jgi:hypothetical protein